MKPILGWREKIAVALIFFANFLFIQPTDAEQSQNTVIAAFDVTETITEDRCFPERDNFQNKFRLYLIRTAAGKLLFWNPDANFLNPVEHLEIPLDIKLAAAANLKAERFKAHHTSDFDYGRIGILASDLDMTGRISPDILEATFANTVRFTVNELKKLPLELWVDSYRALKKVGAKVDSLATISTGFPCHFKGTLSGVPRSIPENFIFEKERDFIFALRKSEEHFAINEIDKSIDHLEKAAVAAPERAAPYWRLSRAYFVLAEHLPIDDRAGRLKYLKKAHDYGLKGVHSDPASGESWFFLTVARGRYATTKGLIKMIRETGQLEQDFLKALASHPKYNFSGFTTAGDIRCGLGIYYRLVPDWWIVKAITGSRGDLDKSVDYLRQAVKFQPYRIEYLKELGVSLTCRGLKRERQKDIEEGLQTFRNALKLTTLLQTDIIDKEQMEDLLKNYQKVCAYSRDGYQDLDQPIPEAESTPPVPQEHPSH